MKLMKTFVFSFALFAGLAATSKTVDMKSGVNFGGGPVPLCNPYVDPKCSWGSGLH